MLFYSRQRVFPKIIIRRYHYFKDRASRVQKESFSDLKVQSVASQCFHVLPRRSRFSSFSSKIAFICRIARSRTSIASYCATCAYLLKVDQENRPRLSKRTVPDYSLFLKVDQQNRPHLSLCAIVWRLYVLKFWGAASKASCTPELHIVTLLAHWGLEPEDR